MTKNSIRIISLLLFVGLLPFATWFFNIKNGPLIFYIFVFILLTAFISTYYKSTSVQKVEEKLKALQTVDRTNNLLTLYSDVRAMQFESIWAIVILIISLGSSFIFLGTLFLGTGLLGLISFLLIGPVVLLGLFFFFVILLIRINQNFKNAKLLKEGLQNKIYSGQITTIPISIKDKIIKQNPWIALVKSFGVGIVMSFVLNPLYGIGATIISGFHFFNERKSTQPFEVLQYTTIPGEVSLDLLQDVQQKLIFILSVRTIFNILTVLVLGVLIIAAI